MLKQEELNILFQDYYKVMDGLEPERVQKRIDMANELYDVVMLYYLLLDNAESQAVLESQLANEMYSVVAKYGDIDDYTIDLVDGYAKDIVKTNAKHPDNEYYTSDDRAVNIAQDLGNSFENYFEYVDAVKNNKSKTWFTQNDPKVRATHEPLNGQKKNMDETFTVGGYPMRFPKDTYYGASADEVVNCRCFLKFN